MGGGRRAWRRAEGKREKREKRDKDGKRVPEG